mmetsp:Transcript_2958/g.3435  ORF Transcript_2958/g.3435 Transcript_2958/m.3435 type:complete len:182 (+) Transcript_2958:93-638(+)
MATSGTPNGDRGEPLPEPSGGEKLPHSHKVWGQIEPVNSSCDSESLNRKVATIGDKISFISITDSSESVHKEHSGAERHHESVPLSGEDDDLSSEEQTFESLMTPGGQWHTLGKCKPCHFFRAGNTCRNGSECTFCHFHPAVRRKRPGKRKRAKMAARLSAEAQQPKSTQTSASSRTLVSL